jgi:uncharacterized protein YggU (UPF0235/DUF167 family)
VSRDGSGSGDALPAARIRLRVVPGARNSQVVGRYGEDAWKVRVTAAPERGRANADVCALIASVAGVSRSCVEVVTGASSRDKLVAVSGMEATQLARMLDAASGK